MMSDSNVPRSWMWDTQPDVKHLNLPRLPEPEHWDRGYDQGGHNVIWEDPYYSKEQVEEYVKSILEGKLEQVHQSLWDSGWKDGTSSWFPDSHSRTIYRVKK